MRFQLADELLSRRAAGEIRSPAADHLGLSLVQFARGVAVYELPVRSNVCDGAGRVEPGVIAALGEAAMRSAALTIAHDGDEPWLTDLTAHFERPVACAEAERLRAEAIVMRVEPASVRIEADVLCGGERVATFAATQLRSDWTRRPVPLRQEAAVA